VYTYIGGEHLKLEYISQLIQGVTVNRIEAFELNDESTALETLSLKAFNDALGITYRGIQDKSEVIVYKQKVHADVLTDANSLIWHSLSQKAVLLPPHYSGLLITNNFIKMKCEESVDLSYLEWVLNEHPLLLKQLAALSAGSVISTLKLSSLRELDIPLPPLEKQKLIGHIARLKKKKASLLKEQLELEQHYIHLQLLEQMKSYS